MPNYSYETLSAETARREMAQQPAPLVLDVREADEYADGHIPFAVNAPLSCLAEQLADLAPDKAARILIYCLSGRRSAIAAGMLAGAGYSRVANFGGILDWPYEIVN